MDKLEKRVSVRALVESVLIGGDIMRTGSTERMIEGMRGHRRLQEEYAKKAVSEFSLSASAESERVVLEVHGRADVVWMRDSAPAVVEEIKTTWRDPASVSSDDYPLHWAQAECYAHILCKNYGLERIEVRLTYAQAYGNATARITRGFTARDLQRRFDELTGAMIAHIERQLDWQAVRDASIRELAFPFSGYRAGQRQMTVAAYRVCKRGGRMLCEAPTGIGKTAAMLYSALKAVGHGEVERLFYLTARGTTALAARDGLRHLRGKGLRARSIALSAKEKVCAFPGSPCAPQTCPRAKGHYDRLTAGLQEALDAREDYDAEFIAELCERRNLCPFEFALDLSLECDVIIGDYNYAFDPFARLKRYFLDKSDAALLIDEAHNLPDRAREMFSAALDRRELEALRGDMRSAPNSREYKALDALIRAMKELEGGGARAEPLPEPLAEAAARFADAARSAAQDDVPYAAAMLDSFFAASAFTLTAGSMREQPRLYATLIEPPVVTLRCLMPAPLLRETLDRVRTAVFFSATLSPPSYFRDMLGAGKDAVSLALPSPFPNENLLVLHYAADTRYRARASSAEEVAASIAALCGSKANGNYLVFFPSYSYLRTVMPLVGNALPGARLTVQRSGMREAERAAFLAAFSEAPRGVMVAFAVMGGVFSEGVDLPGARLSGCAVVGVGLPQVCLERETLRERCDEEYDSGFAYSYVFPGLARVVQAAGRVIRTAQDRGIVLLIDERFARYDHDELLPPHWAIRRAKNAEAVGRNARRFWGEGDEGDDESLRRPAF